MTLITLEYSRDGAFLYLPVLRSPICIAGAIKTTPNPDLLAPTRTAAVNSSIIPSSFTPQIRLQNPSTKPLVYQVILTGKDRADFTLPMGDTVQVQSKGQLQMPVEFRSRFLRPCGATLVLVGKRVGSPCGSTLVFTLDTCIDNIVPMVTGRLSAAPQSYMIIEVSYSRFRC